MTPLFASAVTVAVLVGLVLCIAGLRKTPPAAPTASPTLLVPARWLKFGGTTISTRTRILLIAGVAAGLLAWVTTGWVIAVIVLPAALAGIPYVLGFSGRATLIPRLEAMEEWTRSLAGVLTVGVGLEQALKVTLHSTPEAIRPEVTLLVARLNARWPVEAALRAFADDLDDSTGDIVVFYLLSGARQRGPGLANVLEALATSVAEDVRNRRAVEADRAQPRATARWVTLITVGVMAAMVLLRASYIDTYKSGLGQTLLFLLLGIYAACLVWMQRTARGSTVPRFLTAAATTANPRPTDTASPLRTTS